MDCRDLKQIDWDEPAACVDARIHRYRMTKAGLVTLGKSAVSAQWMDVACATANSDGTMYREGTEWRQGDLLWRVERLRRRDVLDDELRRVLDRLRLLGSQYGDANARWLVWFDS